MLELNHKSSKQFICELWIASQEGRVAVDSVLDLQACVLTWTSGAGITAEISLLSPDPFPRLQSQETGLSFVLQTHIS